MAERCTSRTGRATTIYDHRHRRAAGHRRRSALGRAGRADHRAPRRTALLQRPIRVPGPLRLRQLPPGSDLRRPSVGPGARRLRQGHRGQPPAGRRRRYRALQMERRQSEPGDGVRTAHREVLLPLAELQRRGADRPGDVYQIDSAAPQPPPAAERRTDAGAGARQSDFRARAHARTARRFRKPTVQRVPFRPALHESEDGRRRHRQADRPVAAVRHAAIDNIALTAPYLHDGSARTLEEIWTVFNPNGPARRHQRSPERRAERPDRVPEDFMKRRSRFCCWRCRRRSRRRRTCRVSAGRTSPRPNGLPDDHVFSVCVDGDRVWAATENGLGLYQNGKWRVFTPADGLAHRAVLFVAPDKRTGDVWVATMGGLSRYSAGRFDNFTQLNSGLPNDVVYGVGVQGDSVWVATAAGGGRLNTRTGEWSYFNERNTPDVRDLDVRRERHARARSTTRSGAAASSSTT